MIVQTIEEAEAWLDVARFLTSEATRYLATTSHSSPDLSDAYAHAHAAEMALIGAGLCIAHTR